MKINTIGHVKSGSSDKVYVVAIVDHKDGTYSVVGRYGRNQGNIKEDIKASRVSKWSAEEAARKLVDSKFHRSRNPYIDIDSPEYRGSLTRSDYWLKNWLEDENTPKPAQPKKADPAPKPAPKTEQKPKVVEPEVLICINNVGYEHLFDEGIEYLFKGRNGEFVTVIDKYGEKQEVFSERFVTEKEYAKTSYVLAVS